MKTRTSLARQLTPHALAVAGVLALLVALVRFATHIDFDDVTTIWPEPPTPRALEAAREPVVASFARREASPRVVILPRPDAAPAEPAPATTGTPHVELPAPPEVVAWVRDLASDDIPHNADIAERKLRWRKDAIGELRGALRSLDDQQRHYAAQILYHIVDQPGDDLLAVAVESLAIDLHHERILVFELNASYATRYLVKHADRARDQLLPSLHGDPQERFLAAYVLAMGGADCDPEPLVDVLARHLPDDDRRTNAVLAREALRALGPAALPRLRRLTHNTRDRQTQEIVADLEGGPWADIGGYSNLVEIVNLLEDIEASRWP